MSPEAIAVLATAPWPGNVRQLRQAVREVASLTSGAVIPDELVRQVTGQTSQLPSLDEARDEFTRLARRFLGPEVISVTGHRHFTSTHGEVSR